MLTLRPGTKVRFTKNGTTVEGTTLENLSVFYPDSTVTKYGNGTMGRAVRGYRVRSPIVQQDGSLYTVRGRVVDGIGYVAADDLMVIA